MDFPNGEKLHGVQVAALKVGMRKKGFAYFMEQGLGKSGTLLMDFADKVKRREATRLVVICPNSFKGGWLDEISKWGFDYDGYAYEAGASANDYWLRRVGDKPPVLIINVESCRLGGTKKQPKNSAGLEFVRSFADGHDVMIAVDESIMISTHDSMQTKGVLSIRDLGEWRRDLSGKPQKQGPHDLWSQMRFIGGFDGVNYYQFRGTYCRMGGYMGKAVVGAQNEDILQERLQPWVFRATKEDWAPELPPKSYTIREYRLSSELKSHYLSMEQEFITWLEDGEMVTVDAAITKYIKLAQIQAGFIYDADGGVNWLVDNDQNPRLNALDDFLHNELVGKAVVVYNHKPVFEQLMRRFADMAPAFIHGGMTTTEVEGQKAVFNGDDDCRIIFVTKSAKYGHTLLGNQKHRDTACATEVFYENTYALDDRSQLEDRPHRHGQLQDAMSYIDFAGTPLDRDCIKALQRKESIFQAVFKPLASKRQRP